MDTDRTDFCSSTAQKDFSCANECQSRSKVKLMMRVDTPPRVHTFKRRSTNTAQARNKTSEQAVLFFENTFYDEFQSLTTNDLTSVWLNANIYSLWLKVFCPEFD